MTEKNSDANSNTPKPSNAPEAETPSGTSGFWVAACMIGLLVLIVAVEMLRSKS